MKSAVSEDRARGALVGLAVGDALGAPVEFMARGTFPPVADFAPTPRWGLEAGQWTDDTIMALCLGEALLAAGGYDSWTVMGEYMAWYREGKHTPMGRCFDIGNQTVESLTRYEKEPVMRRWEPRSTSAGNGVIMRLAPAAIVAANAEERSSADHLLSVSARETHYSLEAEEATVIFGRMLRAALQGAPRSFLLPAAAGATDSFGLLSLLNDTRPDSEVSGSGYVRLSLQAAWWSFLSTDNFRDCVLAAVNLGDDADTTAAIAGQLAGAYYGLSGIPWQWRAGLWRSAELTDLASSLLTVPCRVLRTRFEEDGELLED